MPMGCFRDGFDPAGQPIEAVRGIRDDIRARIEALITEIVPDD